MSKSSPLQLFLAWDPHYRVTGVSLAGTGHQRQGIVCQDAHRWVCLEDKAILAVADGAGSAPHSDVGSAVAVKAATDFFADRPGFSTARLTTKSLEKLLRAAFAKALRSVEGSAAESGRELHDLSTTLIIAVAAPGLIGAAQLGDGAVVIRNEDGKIIALTTPQQGEYINQTTFLTSQRALERVAISIIETRADDLAVFTDGLDLLALKYPTGEPHEKFFVPLFDYFGTHTQSDTHEALKEFLTGSAAQHSTDDLTLVLGQFLK